MFLFQIVNELIIDILVGVILACLKAIANIDQKVSNDSITPRENIYSHYGYNHWERTILWLEDITEANFSYLPEQVRFISFLIGAFYGTTLGIILFVADRIFGFEISAIELLLVSLVLGAGLGLAGAKSLTSRPSIFDIKNDEFKGDFFDR